MVSLYRSIVSSCFISGYDHMQRSLAVTFLYAGVEKLLSTFDHIHSRLVLDDNRESVPLGLLFIKQLFHNVQFQQAVAVHQKLVNLTAHSLRLEPLDRDTLDLVNAITCDFDTDPVSFVKEFIALFDNNLHLTVRYDCEHGIFYKHVMCSLLHCKQAKVGCSSLQLTVMMLSM